MNSCSIRWPRGGPWYDADYLGELGTVFAVCPNPGWMRGGKLPAFGLGSRGTPSGTLSAGKYSASGLYFNGTDNIYTFARCLSPASLPISFTCLGRPLSSPANQALLSTSGSTGNYDGVAFGLGSSANALIGDGTGVGSGSRRSGSTSGSMTLSFGKFYHVVLVVRGATDMSAWVDGESIPLTYSGTGGAYVPGSSAGVLGAKLNTSATGYCNCHLAMLTLHFRELTGANVTRLVSDPLAPFRRPTRRRFFAPAVSGHVPYSLILGRSAA